jgi:hypothetical protein
MRRLENDHERDLSDPGPNAGVTPAAQLRVCRSRLRMIS